MQSFYEGPPKLIPYRALDPQDLEALVTNPLGLQFRYVDYYRLIDHLDRHNCNEISDTLRLMYELLPRHNMRLIVDLKYWRQLRTDQMPANSTWHQDSVQDDCDEPVENHVLYSTGTALSQTAFLTRSVPKNASLETIQEAAFITPSDSFVCYSRYHLHAATPAKQNGWRLLLRLSNANTVRLRPFRADLPPYHPQQPYRVLRNNALYGIGRT